MYVYLRTEPQTWTVGFYTPEGHWVAESDHDEPEDAVKRTRYLNGGNDENEGNSHQEEVSVAEHIRELTQENMLLRSRVDVVRCGECARAKDASSIAHALQKKPIVCKLTGKFVCFADFCSYGIKEKEVE